jgi:hypothetical protein
MRKLALSSLIVLFLCLLGGVVQATATEQGKPTTACPLPETCVAGEALTAESADLRTGSAFCSLGMPRLMIDVCVGYVGLTPGPITLGDLADAAGWQRQTLPEPCTIAVWSLIGLCWGGVSCWRRRRGLPADRVAWDRPRARCRSARPPWPDDVRARILEIVEKGVPR